MEEGAGEEGPIDPDPDPDLVREPFPSYSELLLLLSRLDLIDEVDEEEDDLRNLKKPMVRTGEMGRALWNG